MTKTAENVFVAKYKLSPGLINQIRKESPLPLEEFKIKLDKTFEVKGNKVFISKNSSNPSIGDMKISFKIIKPQAVSILAGQNAGAVLGPYTTPYGSYEQLVPGTVDAQGMITSAKASNNSLTWILRIVGLVAVFIGFTLIFKPLSVLADVIPFIGDIVEMGTGILAILLTIPLVTIVIGIAWIYYRPIIGIPLVVIAVGSIATIFILKKKRA